MSVMPKNALQLTVTQCRNFMDDDQFALTRSSIKKSCGGKSWPAIIDKILAVECTDDTNLNMDSVQFLGDRFELIADLTGFAPEDIKCIMTPETLELEAEKKNAAGTQYRSIHMKRSYQLPQKVDPKQGNCLLSAEGVLVISVPWSK